MFRLKLFGSASIEGPDGPVTGRAVQRRRLALLALLASARQRGVTREKLVGYLWPDSDPERARHLLSDSIYRINQAVGGEALIAAGDELRLNPERLPCDVWEFADAIERRDWERAAALHSAPFLDGFYLTAADELERWVDAERERLNRDHGRALEALAEAAEQEGALPEAIHWWRSLAGHDPYSSRIALRLMRALDRSGDRAAALRHAEAHAQLLAGEMGLSPDAELVEYAAGIRARHAPAMVDAAPAASSDVVGRPPAVRERQPAVDAEARRAGEPVEREGGRIDHAAPAGQGGARRRRILAAAAAVLVLAVSMAAVAVATWRAGRPADVDAIAVLPFEDLSAGGDYEYFADGMTEELMVQLSNVEGLRVVGRSSVFALKDQAIDVREVARRLNATAVLQGSVRQWGDSLRIAAQLTDGRDGYQLWAETYQRAARDVFAMQDDIAREIVRRLRGDVAATDDERSTAPPDPVAFNLYLKGRYEWHRRTEQSLRAAADYFRQATELAPDYARAHAGLGDAYAVLGFYDFLPPREAFPAAEASARRALELESSLAEPHATIGYVALYHDWDWLRAEREFRRAIELAPAYSTAHQWYGNLLTAMGRFDEATMRMEAAMELDPLSVIANAALGWVLYFSGDYDRAVAQYTRALELDPNFALAYLWRGMAHEERGDMAAALPDFERSVQLSGGSTLHVALHARALALAGQQAEARALVQDLHARQPTDYVPPYEMAKVYDALGDTAAALDALERAYEERSHSIAFLAVDPQLEGLRSKPRFQSLLRRAGLD